MNFTMNMYILRLHTNLPRSYKIGTNSTLLPLVVLRLSCPHFSHLSLPSLDLLLKLVSQPHSRILLLLLPVGCKSLVLDHLVRGWSALSLLDSLDISVAESWCKGIVLLTVLLPPLLRLLHFSVQLIILIQ